MKKILLTGSLLLLGNWGAFAQSYYLPNSGFDNWKEQSGKTTLTATTSAGSQDRPGTEPQEWNGSNIEQAGFTFDELVTQNPEGVVQLYNKNLVQNVPGYMTLATPWVFAYGSGFGMAEYANYGDGGSYGGVDFKYLPDAISLRYKKSGKTNEKSHVIAYLWSGTFKSKIPTDINKSGDIFRPTYEVVYNGKTLDDVDRVVMGIQDDAYVTQKGTLVASLDKVFTDDIDWTSIEIPFEYKSEGTPEKMNVILSASDYWTRENVTAGTTFQVDDVQLVYWSNLKSLTYDGQTLDESALSQLSQEKGNVTVDFSSKTYDPEKLSYVLKGRGATAKLGEFDKNTSTITLTVYGNDYGQTMNNGEKSDNKTVYTLQFAPDASRVTDQYTSIINVSMEGSAFPSINDVNIDEKGGTIEFTMKGFVFAGTIPVGDVTLKDATLSYASDGSINIVAPNQSLSLYNNSIKTNVSLEGNITDVDNHKELKATVNIEWYKSETETENIIVDVQPAPFRRTLNGKTLEVTGDVAADYAFFVVPADANIAAVNLKEAVLSGDITTTDFAVSNPNILFYAAEGATLTGNNVVKGTECENLVLTDGLTFNAPEGFEAAKVTFNRKFTAGNLSTVVLPFSFDAADVNGTVYKLESVENGVLSFKSVEGTADANVPYLVKTKGDNLFKGTLTNAIVAQTPKTVENRITGTGVTHVGNFGETMEIKPDDQTSWYGYNKNGSFVKVLSGTVKPFRSAIKSTGAAPSSFALKLDGTVTGILNLENPNAKVDVYTISGVCVRKNVPAASALNGLSRGVYIVGGQKVVK